MHVSPIVSNYCPASRRGRSTLTDLESVLDLWWVLLWASTSSLVLACRPIRLGDLQKPLVNLSSMNCIFSGPLRSLGAPVSLAHADRVPLQAPAGSDVPPAG